MRRTRPTRYDALNRLQSAGENTTAWQQTYDLDRFGNRAVRSTSYIPNPQLTPQSASLTDFSAFDQSTNRLSMSKYPQVLYDFAGNLKRDQAGSQFTYDGGSRQITASVGGASASYFYDGDGQRVKKVVGTVTTVFVYNASGQLMAEYVSDPVPPAAGGGGTSYLTNDHLGSTRVVTKSDGSVKARYDYLPFGEELPSTVGGRSGVTGYSGADSTRQRFTSKERDVESGLDYFLARYYSSAQSRFTSVDPVGGSGIDAQSWNGYAYSRNNPLKYIDPEGLKYRLTDLDGNSADDYSDDDFNKNFRRNKNVQLRDGNIYLSGELIGHYERLSFDDFGLAGNLFYREMSARRGTSLKAIGGFAVGTYALGAGGGAAAYFSGVALGGSSTTTLGLGGAAEAANAAEAASIVTQAASTIGNQGMRASSRAVAEQAARKWVGEGARNIVDRQTGQIVGRISADGTRIAWVTSASKADPYINLVDKVTGGNLHVCF